MYKHIFILFSLLLSINALAQNTVIVKGKVVDEASVAIPYANVAAYRTADSALVEGTATGELGLFELNLEPGNYYLRITFLTYDPKIIRNIDINTSEKDLGIIKLKENAVGLDEVIVTETKSQMQLQLDKKVYNVGSDLTDRGGNASDILDNVPSVTVDVEGNVSLRGSQNVRILINGKPSGLVGISSTDALRQIPANMIERVEIITNPSARYEAEGEVGIINIILKKEQSKGVNGSINATAGYPEDFGVGVNLNWRRDVINLFTNIGLNYDKNPGGGFSEQTFFDNGVPIAFSESETERVRGGTSGFFQFGTDIFLNDFNTITASGLYETGAEDNYAEVVYRDFNAEGQLIGNSIRIDDEVETEHDIETALNYTRKFKQKDRKWTIDLSYNLNDDTEKSDFRETNGSEVIFQRSTNTEDQTNLLVQTDYIHPIGTDGKFEAGLKGTYRDIENDYTVEQLDSDNNWYVLPEFDDELAYQENISAAYIIYGNKMGKFSFQAGVRGEYSDITATLIKLDTSTHKEYFQLFPSAHITYEINELNQLQLSYSRRLSRPRFRYLLPFSNFSDSRVRWQGNPDLDPEFSNSFEFGYLRYLDKGSILTNLYYRHITGVIERVTLVNEVNEIEVFPINLSTANAFGVELSGNYDLTKWWTLTGSVNFYHQVTNGEFRGENLSSEATTATTRWTTRFKLPKQLNIQTSFDYRAPSNTTQGRRLAMYAWDAGVSKDIFKGKGTLTLSARDILNSRQRRMITETPEYYAESEFRWRSRSVILNFSYRINRQKDRNRDNGAPRDEDMDF